MEPTCILCGAETHGNPFYCRDHAPHLRTAPLEPGVLNCVETGE